MFTRAPDSAQPTITASIDGKPIKARRGDTVAAALLAAGHLVNRTTPVTGAPRSAFCLMGVCFECLVTIDGVGNRQGCLIEITEGMNIETQVGKRSLHRS